MRAPSLIRKANFLTSRCGNHGAPLLPFLYHTTTILRPYATQARRDVNSSDAVFRRKPRSKKPRLPNAQFADSPQDIPYAGNEVGYAETPVRKFANPTSTRRIPSGKSISPKPNSADSPLDDPAHARDATNVDESSVRQFPGGKPALVNAAHAGGEVTSNQTPRKKSRNEKRLLLKSPSADSPLAGKDYVPFEGASDKKSTITPTERKAFEKIIAARNKSAKDDVKASAKPTTGRRKKSDDDDVRTSARPTAGRRQKLDDEDVQYSGAITSLDSLLDSALSESTPPPEVPVATPPFEPAASSGVSVATPLSELSGSSEGSVVPLRKIAKRTSTPRQPPGPTELARDQSNTMRAQRARERLQAIAPIVHAGQALEETKAVRRLMEGAESDIEVWRIFKERVLDVLKTLGTDGNAGAIEPEAGGGEAAMADVGNSQAASATSLPDSAVDETTAIAAQSTALTPPPPTIPTSPSRSLDTLATTLSFHTWHAQHVLALHFPSSSLALSVLPAIRGLGPQAAALALTSHQYNVHMQAHWTRYQDVPTMLALLREMEAEVMEFTRHTRNVVWTALQYIDSALAGEKGPVAKRVWAGEGRKNGWGELSGWLGRLNRVIFEEKKEKEVEQSKWDEDQGGEGEEERRRFTFVPAGGVSPGHRRAAARTRNAAAAGFQEAQDTLSESIPRRQIEAAGPEVDG
ncbi:hypothetical protein LTR09_006176 [Extremus antarcticus]|uniref:Mtf2-like C-terminal domain-containing protein n=1 Tax=Extremus antarcticus TaxID=702011 RepID=A0AAJ0DER5_9PEZI|nr:hypothetical protein LTR09_006176 [Extremus antarcticus]